MRASPTGFARVAVACLAVLSAALADVGWSSHAYAQTDQKQVLVLYANRRDAQIVVTGERELPRILDAGLDHAVDYYSEYIDSARFPDVAYQNAFRDFLLHKYGDLRFDVIIVVDLALDFIRGRRHELFPDTPLVFFATSTATPRLPNSTGVVTSLNYGGTVAFAAELQPSLKHLFVVTGAARADVVTEARVREQFRPFESRLDIVYLAGLPAPDLEARLKTLPPQSAVYYVRRPGRRWCDVPSADLPRPRRGRRQRPSVLVGRFDDGPWRRRRQHEGPDCTNPIRRGSRGARASR